MANVQQLPSLDMLSSASKKEKKKSPENSTDKDNKS
jgi:hypothetical protein